MENEESLINVEQEIIPFLVSVLTLGSELNPMVIFQASNKSELGVRKSHC